MKFNGPDYEPKEDDHRLIPQYWRVYKTMKDGRWSTLGEIEALTGDPQSSISAQMRHMRKERFGAHDVQKRSRGDRSTGLWEYRLIVRTPGPRQMTFSDSNGE